MKSLVQFITEGFLSHIQSNLKTDNYLAIGAIMDSYEVEFEGKSFGAMNDNDAVIYGSPIFNWSEGSKEEMAEMLEDDEELIEEIRDMYSNISAVKDWINDFDDQNANYTALIINMKSGKVLYANTDGGIIKTDHNTPIADLIKQVRK